ncbi:MAG: RluA family pseudouridine synthase [Alphaproteobacteria bacterium]
MTENNIYFTSIAKNCDSKTRLDKFLTKEIKDLSRASIQRLIDGGFISLDEEIIFDKNYKIKEGDSFQVVIPPATEADPLPENIDIEIVCQDKDVVIVNKPAGMTVHPAPGQWTGTLVNALLFHIKDLSGIGGVKRPGIVHRIDKDTSGILVVAKNDIAHQKLSEQFFNHSINRTYYAVCNGLPNPLNGTIDKNIGRSKFDRQKMAVLEAGGKRAITHYQTISTNNGVSLIKCNLETGRTHQIRVHMSSIGCSLVGDKTYGKGKIDFPRQALHAKSLGFIHPTSGEEVFYESDFPEDFKQLMQTQNLEYK